jgi:hypothetical protein
MRFLCTQLAKCRNRAPESRPGSRFVDLNELSYDGKEPSSHLVAIRFADFLLDNIDLLRQLEASFRAGKWGTPLELWYELERKAQGRI